MSNELYVIVDENDMSLVNDCVYIDYHEAVKDAKIETEYQSGDDKYNTTTMLVCSITPLVRTTVKAVKYTIEVEKVGEI